MNLWQKGLDEQLVLVRVTYELGKAGYEVAVHRVLGVGHELRQCPESSLLQQQQQQQQNVYIQLQINPTQFPMIRSTRGEPLRRTDT